MDIHHLVHGGVSRNCLLGELGISWSRPGDSAKRPKPDIKHHTARCPHSRVVTIGCRHSLGEEGALLANIHRRSGARSLCIDLSLCVVRGLGA